MVTSFLHFPLNSVNEKAATRHATTFFNGFCRMFTVLTCKLTVMRNVQVRINVLSFEVIVTPPHDIAHTLPSLHTLSHHCTQFHIIAHSFTLLHTLSHHCIHFPIIAYTFTLLHTLSHHFTQFPIIASLHYSLPFITNSLQENLNLTIYYTRLE